MTLAFNEAANFMQYRDKYFTTDPAFSAVQQSLLANPEAGAVIRGCSGLRKMRWADARRDKGKRGGLRIIYLYLPELQKIVFIDVYAKDEAEDLSAEDRKGFKALVQSIRADFARKERAI